MCIPENWIPAEINFDELFIGCYILADEALASVETQFNGIVAVFDMHGLNFQQIRQCTPHRLRRFAHSVQVCLKKLIVKDNEISFFVQHANLQ